MGIDTGPVPRLNGETIVLVPNAAVVDVNIAACDIETLARPTPPTSLASTTGICLLVHTQNTLSSEAERFPTTTTRFTW